MLALDDACRQFFCRGYALRHAAREGDVEEVKILLASGVNPDIVSRQQHRLFRPWLHARPALWHAVANDHPRVVDVLLGHGANPNVIGWMASTPLWTACCMGNAQMVVRLLGAGADPNLSGCRGSSPLGAWLGTVAVPHAVDPRLQERSEEALAIGRLLSQAGAKLDEMEMVLEQCEELLGQAGYPTHLIYSSQELQALRAERQAQLLRQSSPEACAASSRGRL